MFPIDATDILFDNVAAALNRRSATLLAQHIRDGQEARRVVTQVGARGEKCYWHNEGAGWSGTVCLRDGTATGVTLDAGVAADENNSRKIADSIFAALRRRRAGLRAVTSPQAHTMNLRETTDTAASAIAAAVPERGAPNTDAPAVLRVHQPFATGAAHTQLAAALAAARIGRRTLVITPNPLAPTLASLAEGGRAADPTAAVVEHLPGEDGDGSAREAVVLLSTPARLKASAARGALRPDSFDLVIVGESDSPHGPAMISAASLFNDASLFVTWESQPPLVAVVSRVAAARRRRMKGPVELALAAPPVGDLALLDVGHVTIYGPRHLLPPEAWKAGDERAAAGVKLLTMT